MASWAISHTKRRCSMPFLQLPVGRPGPLLHRRCCAVRVGSVRSTWPWRAASALTEGGSGVLVHRQLLRLKALGELR